MKTHISECDYHDGNSFMEIQNKWGCFSHLAIVDKEDADIANKWDGWDICRYKCETYSEKERKKCLYHRYLGAKTVYDSLKNSLDAKSLNKIERQVDAAYKLYSQSKKRYEELKNTFDIFCKTVVDSRKKIQSKKKERL